MLVSGIYIMVLAFNDTIIGLTLLANFTALRFVLYGITTLLLLLITGETICLKCLNGYCLRV
jgi:hypothetical protein